MAFARAVYLASLLSKKKIVQEKLRRRNSLSEAKDPKEIISVTKNSKQRF